MRFLFLIFLFALQLAFASNVTYYDYTLPYLESGTTTYLPSGSTIVYTMSVASTPVNTFQIYACDTSGKLIKLASGTTTAATDLFWMPVSGCQMFNLTTPIPAGTQLNIKSGGTTSTGVPTTGYNALSFFP